MRTNLINQLIASGGINAANSSAISALLGQLAELHHQFDPESAIRHLRRRRHAVWPDRRRQPASRPTFSLNTSDIQNLEHLMLRASHNDPAIAKIGERYPIINATFAPIYNTPAIASVIGNQSYIAPFPVLQL